MCRGFKTLVDQSEAKSPTVISAEPNQSTQGRFVSQQTTGAPQAEGGPTEQASQGAGWTRREVLNAPNVISLLRLASGPVIAHWIVADELRIALAALLCAGWSDWLDGWAARRYNQQSVIGTYLDPLADKALMCCVVTALGVQGTLPGYLAVVVIGRDVFLVAATFAARAHQLHWRRVPLATFFRISSGPSPQDGAPPAQKVQPLYISKVNTVFQLATVSAFLLDACFGGSPAGWLDAAAVITTGTTVWSGGAYVYAYRHLLRR